MRQTLLLTALLWLGSAHVFAADPAHAPTTGHVSHAVDHAQPRPVLPVPSAMPGVLVMIVLWMFVVAAVIGPVVGYHAPEEPPEPSSHHDDHGAHDAHHGHAH